MEFFERTTVPSTEQKKEEHSKKPEEHTHNSEYKPKEVTETGPKQSIAEYIAAEAERPRIQLRPLGEASGETANKEESGRSQAATIRERVLQNVTARFEERNLSYTPRENVSAREVNKAVEQTAKSIAGPDYEMPREKASDVRRQVEYNASMRENFERPDAMLTTGEFKAREEAGLSNIPSVNPDFKDTEFLAQNQYIPGGSWYYRGYSTMRGMSETSGTYHLKSPTTPAPGMPSGINYPSSSRGQYQTQPPPSVFPGLRPNYLGNVQTNVATKGQPRKPSNSTAGLRTGSWKPQTQAEKALEAQVRQNPRNGAVLSTKMGDPRWNAKDGWVKMEQTRNGVTIHYNYNQRTREVEDVKVEGPSKNGLPPLRRPPK